VPTNKREYMTNCSKNTLNQITEAHPQAPASPPRRWMHLLPAKCDMMAVRPSRIIPPRKPNVLCTLHHLYNTLITTINLFRDTLLLLKHKPPEALRRLRLSVILIIGIHINIRLTRSTVLLVNRLPIIRRCHCFGVASNMPKVLQICIECILYIGSSLHD